jgi:hypothetical protein
MYRSRPATDGGAFLVARSHLGQQGVEMRARKVPLERARDAFVVALEVQKPSLDRFQAGEVTGDKRFALHDREVDLDLIEPAGVHRPWTGTTRG